MSDNAWAEAIEAVCIVVIRDGDRGAILDAMGASRASEHAATFREAEAAWDADAVPVQLWTTGRFSIVVEPNGYQGSLEETLVALAPKQDAVSLFWNANAEMQVMVLEGGKVVRTFDPLMYDDGEPPLAEESGLPFGTDDGDLQAAVLTFLERRLGFVLTEKALLDEAHPTFAGKSA